MCIGRSWKTLVQRCLTDRGVDKITCDNGTEFTSKAMLF